MRPSTRVPVQAVVILGFVISALAGVISYVDTVSQRGYHFSSLRVVMLPLFNPLIVILVVVAWWWLTRIEASDEAGRRILQRAFLAFAAQYLLTTIFWIFLITPFNAGDGFWYTTSMWFDLIGAGISSIGLFLLSRSVTVRTPVIDPVEESPALS
jgi:hypothetical protein